ncbi:zinc finger C-x8-C-x5-C-x3-H type family protein, partial [Striga asiatica]
MHTHTHTHTHKIYTHTFAAQHRQPIATTTSQSPSPPVPPQPVSRLSATARPPPPVNLPLRCTQSLLRPSRRQLSSPPPPSHLLPEAATLSSHQTAVVSLRHRRYASTQSQPAAVHSHQSFRRRRCRRAAAPHTPLCLPPFTSTSRLHPHGRGCHL